MGLSIHPPLLLSFVLLFLLHAPTHAVKKSYIVYMEAPSPDSSLLQLDSVTNMHYDTLGTVLGSSEKAKESIFYSYNRYINGFAAVLDEGEAAEVAKNPKVLSVFENKGRKLHTTRSWEFMGVENNGQLPADSAWKLARYGEDTIIGNLDTGVWPESKSFTDEGMGPVPSRWRGTCQSDTNDGVKCNRKLIGVKYFNKGYAAVLNKPLNASFQTARDHTGHGSHTLSTAGGNFVQGASVLGYGNGTAKGGSPKARVAAYKVCWPPIDGSECFDADILAAFEAAVSDGVDVLSVSLGGGTSSSEYFESAIGIGSFHAVQKGIVVVCSAGNYGPTPGTVENLAPWILTVGASTLDRDFSNYAALGNNKQIKGASLSARGLPKLYPLISSAQAKAANASVGNATICEDGTLDPVKARGKIVVCLRGENARVDKGLQAVTAGAVGMILANDEDSENEIIADPHLLPATHINYTDGQIVYDYLNSTKNPTASITNVMTQIGVKPAPVMAAFSSRGPNNLDPGILKPDITAPGVAIIAAYTEAVSPTEVDFDKRRFPYNTMSGTSMSCPHISGVVGLLKTLHPDWSPAAIRSAIMTTATTQANDMKGILDASNAEAIPFAYGAGHVQPNHAMDPGLIYDLTVNDYLNYLCGRGYNQTSLQVFFGKPYVCPKSFTLTDLNYPSITVTNPSAGSVTVTRTVTNVGSPSTYNVRITEPTGVFVTVMPSILNFKAAGEKQTFKVTLKLNLKVKIRDYVFGELLWSDGNHNVRSPLVVQSSV